MSPSVACSLLQTSAIARVLMFKPCVFSLCQLLYIHDSTLSLRFCVARFARPFQLIFCRFSAIRRTFRFFSNVISLASRFPTCAPSAIIDVLHSFKCCKFIHLYVIAFVIRRTFTVTERRTANPDTLRHSIIHYSPVRRNIVDFHRC
jgi:hypothetical protein